MEAEKPKRKPRKKKEEASFTAEAIPTKKRYTLYKSAILARKKG